jgi:DNA mismatch repair protein MutS
MKITFQRFGDFYEAFDDEAKAVTKALGIVLTSNRAGRPMAGVPCHSAEDWFAVIRKAGHEVEVA